MILLCYDGSADAQAAVDRAGQLLSGRPATVLTVWEPFVDTMARSGTTMGIGIGMGLEVPPFDTQPIDEASEQAARQRATEGVERARAAGLNPQPRVAARTATVADAILTVADEVDATAIVIGSRGLTGIKSLLLGSVSHALLQHADRTVIVVPSAEVAAERTRRRV